MLIRMQRYAGERVAVRYEHGRATLLTPLWFWE